MKNAWNKFWKWLVISSADPSKASATIQGIGLTFVGLIIFVGQVFHVKLTEILVTNDIKLICTGIGSVLGTLGLIRKIFITVKSSFTTTPIQG